MEFPTIKSNQFRSTYDSLSVSGTEVTLICGKYLFGLISEIPGVFGFPSVVSTSSSRMVGIPGPVDIFRLRGTCFEIKFVHFLI